MHSTVRILAIRFAQVTALPPRAPSVLHNSLRIGILRVTPRLSVDREAARALRALRNVAGSIRHESFHFSTPESLQSW